MSRSTSIMTMSDRELREVRGGQIGMVFQDPMSSLNPTLTVGEQVMEVILRHRGESLRFDELGPVALARAVVPSAASEQDSLTLDVVVAAHIRRVLGRTGGKIHGPGGAGELLGVNPNTLRYRMRKLGIPFRKDLLTE